MKASEIKKALQSEMFKEANLELGDHCFSYTRGFEHCLQLLFPLVETLDKHHKMWNENGDCLSECSTTCKTLTQLADKLNKD